MRSSFWKLRKRNSEETARPRDADMFINIDVYRVRDTRSNEGRGLIFDLFMDFCVKTRKNISNTHTHTHEKKTIQKIKTMNVITGSCTPPAHTTNVSKTIEHRGDE